MSDLEARLRAEGLRPAAPPPDLDAAVSAAVAAAPPRRLPWVLAAAAVIALLGMGGALLLRPDASSHRSPGSGAVSRPSASHSTPGVAIVSSADVGFYGAQLDPSDPRGLTIYVWPPQNGPCGVFDPHPLVEAETATSVVIRVPGRQELRLPVSGTSSGDCTPESARVPVRVALQAPLGGRAVIDALHHHEQYVLDPRTVAVPTYVPPGFLGGTIDLSLYENKPVTRQTWTARQGGHTVRLEVYAAPRSYALIGPGPVVGTVRGRPAHLASRPECLWWVTSAQRGALVCALTERSGAPAPLPPAELLRVARSLP